MRFPNTSILPLPLCCCERYLLNHTTNDVRLSQQILVQIQNNDSFSDGGVFVHLVQPMKCFLQPALESYLVEKRFKKTKGNEK